MDVWGCGCMSVCVCVYVYMCVWVYVCVVCVVCGCMCELQGGTVQGSHH